MRAKRAGANMLPERHDPKFDDGCQPATTAYVPKPHAASRSKLRALRTAEFIQKNREGLIATQKERKRNARQRLIDREDKFVLQQQSVPPGKSRAQMKLQRREDSIAYERTKHENKQQLESSAAETWGSRAARGEMFWEAQSGWNPNPRHSSAAELFTAQRDHLKSERFNVYSETPADPFKTEYHSKRPQGTDDDLILNCARYISVVVYSVAHVCVARINPVAKKCLVTQLKGLRSRDTSFTDYQLYFKDGISQQDGPTIDPREDDPL